MRRPHRPPTWRRAWPPPRDGLLLRRQDPAIDVALVVEQLRRGEPQRELRVRGLLAIRRVHDVLRGLEREVPADGAGVRLVRARGAVDGAHDRDRIRPLQGERHERRGRDELDQAREERLLAMGGVVLLGELTLDLDELEPHDLEAALLVPGEDPAGQLALDAIRLDEDEGSFGHADSPLVGGSSGSYADASADASGSGSCSAGGGGHDPPWAASVKARRASISRPTRRYASPRTSAKPRSVRPSMRSRTAGARTGATRSTSPSRTAASSGSPASSAARPRPSSVSPTGRSLAPSVRPSASTPMVRSGVGSARWLAAVASHRPIVAASASSPGPAGGAPAALLVGVAAGASSWGRG